MTNLSNATIRPLATFTVVPLVTEGVFTRLEPKLKIFLNSNKLTTLPGELFDLGNLRVLSLRGNQLYELPPGIGKLKNLKELNLSQNGLRYLPYEILDLFSDTSRLSSLQLHPNLFHAPQFPPALRIGEEVGGVQYKLGLWRPRPRRGAVCGVSPDQKQRSWHSQWKIAYQARTEVRYFDINGALLKGPNFPDIRAPDSGSQRNGIPVADPEYCPTPPESHVNFVSRAPSLLEVALVACARTSQLPNLASYLSDDCPWYMPKLLADAAIKKEAGGSKCTVCKRNFTIQRTEWIEWWEITRILDQTNVSSSAASPLRQMENERDVLESMVPLMRRGCSWLCVPKNFYSTGDDEE